MAKPKLTLYLDVVSPFAYLAFYVTKNSPIFSTVDMTYTPIFLGGVMKACDNRPPIDIKNKAAWIGTERLRWARLARVPMAPSLPTGFPPLTLTVMRVLCALELAVPDDAGAAQELLIRAFDALYAALWVEGRAVQTAEVFGPVLEGAVGRELAGRCVEMAGEKEAKARLAANTDACLGEGAFGLPWFVATNAKGEKESFWGFDHLGQVIDHLGLERGGQALRAML